MRRRQLTLPDSAWSREREAEVRAAMVERLSAEVAAWAERGSTKRRNAA